jgi:Uncharacterized protein involved in cytokinesis, contains TGc (transglutaminase/protease-like) domain
LKEIIIVLEVNNPSSTSVYSPDVPYEQTLTAAKKLAQNIAAQTNKPEEQMRLLNDYLTEHVVYGSSEEETRAHSTVGVLLDGVAMCAGFTNAVSDICYQLGIPCYQLRDVPGWHVWNVVIIDEQQLMLDTTFNNTGKTDVFFLSKGFGPDTHSYTEALCARLQGYADKLYQTDAARKLLCEWGIIQGAGNGDYALGRAVSYEELAVILCRIDGVQAQSDEVDFSDFARNSGNADWAQMQVGYCMAKGYFSPTLDPRTENRITVIEVCEVLRRHAVKKGLHKEETLASAIEDDLQRGGLMLRGDLFDVLVAYMM